MDQSQPVSNGVLEEMNGGTGGGKNSFFGEKVRYVLYA